LEAEIESKSSLHGRQGYCKSKRSNGLGWKKRFYVIEGRLLKWYKDEDAFNSGKPRGMIDLSKCHCSAASNQKSEGLLRFSIGSTEFLHTLTMESKNEKERNLWLDSLRVACAAPYEVDN